MSPVRRDPRAEQRKAAPGRSGAPPVPDTQHECDCLACTDQEIDPALLIDTLIEAVAPLAESDSALEAELAGATFVATVASVEQDALPAVADAFIPEVESRPGRSALAVLRGLASVASGVEAGVAEAASVAADRMADAGVPEPAWSAELAEPVQVAECLRLHDGVGALAVLVASFRRAGHGHAFVIVVDELNCAAAADIFLAELDQLPGVLDDICSGGRAEGLAFGTQALDPAEFRWYAEEALKARAMHDEDGSAAEASWLGEEDDEGEIEGPPFSVMAQLLRARLAALPEARRPAGARVRSEPGHVNGVTSSLGRSHNGFGIAGFDWAGFDWAGFDRPAPIRLPAKRKKDEPAPIYQIKVTLRRSKPPIWRRLLVPADLSLADLHRVIQAAFGWDDSHMHVFETPYGDFGHADRELGHRAEAPVTLEQVASQAGEKIRYTYDFGDDWEHEILVEKALDRGSGALAHPRCTGGRRAAPPEDCGGIWGYTELMQIVADPRHPDHEERLEWLGLDDPRQFDPAAFDVDEVNQALADLRL